MGLRRKLNETEKERAGEYKRGGRKLKEGQSKSNKGRKYRSCNNEINKEPEKIK